MESGIVAEVEEQVPVERAIIPQGRPAAAADVVALVITLPAELHPGTPIAVLGVAVQPAADRDESELAVVEITMVTLTSTRADATVLSCPGQGTGVGI